MECIGGGGLEFAHHDPINAQDKNGARVVHRKVTVGHVPR